ncbi:MAG: hydrogenase 3 maturation endopeptidase HyCI [Candidatus Omnitrophica bacterium]|nr:hydrogenase 3 maturation endopeptidase HyCI [Candidatus Omnitrophota bacterium]
MKDFAKVLKGKVVCVGVGNVLRADDGLGPALIERIKGHVKAVCIDAGNAPESYTGKIIKESPDTILIIDAVHLGRSPGEYEILGKSDIIKSGFTTHDISPAMLIEYLQVQTKADIYLLGIQPENLTMGEEMSVRVLAAVEAVSKKIESVLGRQI